MVKISNTHHITKIGIVKKNPKKRCNYDKLAKRAVKKFPPAQIGGCYVATRWMIRQCPELKEAVITIMMKNSSCMKHCFAITPDGKVIDTQLFQFGLIMTLPPGVEDKYIFTEEEHKKILGYDVRLI